MNFDDFEVPNALESFDLNQESPPEPMVKEYQLNFLNARKVELSKIKLSFDKKEALNIFFDWSSFSKPYGFEFLGILAEKLIEDLEENSSVRYDFLIARVEAYLKLKEAKLSSLAQVNINHGTQWIFKLGLFVLIKKLINFLIKR